jgi:hypothetical protein
MNASFFCAGLLLNGALALSGADQFVPGCTVPFQAIQTTGLDIDRQCGINGASDQPAKMAESKAKNNFCAPGAPAPITYSTFTKLEAKSTDELRTQVKQNRGVLANLVNGMGEGTLVRFVAFVLDAHFSNVQKGELVNCSKPGQAFNDIHIELVKTASEDDACTSMPRK